MKHLVKAFGDMTKEQKLEYVELLEKLIDVQFHTFKLHEEADKWEKLCFELAKTDEDLKRVKDLKLSIKQFSDYLAKKGGSRE